MTITCYHCGKTKEGNPQYGNQIMSENWDWFLSEQEEFVNGQHQSCNRIFCPECAIQIHALGKQLYDLLNTRYVHLGCLLSEQDQKQILAREEHDRNEYYKRREIT